MNSSRRSLLKGAGAIGAVAALGGLKTVSAETKPTKPAGPQKKGLARGLTLLTMRRNGEYRL
ncbi:MAG: twin-arginine translocation signal domain-containing protein, partial [Terriglobales bacterium]